VIFYDFMDNGKAQSRSSLLGGKKRFENLLFFFKRDSLPGVGDGDPDPFFPFAEEHPRDISCPERVLPFLDTNTNISPI
jgi:hypothetical protein